MTQYSSTSLITEKIEGHLIVTGFQKRTINGPQTLANAQAIIDETEIAQTLKAKQAEKIRYVEKFREATRRANSYHKTASIYSEDAEKAKAAGDMPEYGRLKAAEKVNLDQFKIHDANRTEHQNSVVKSNKELAVVTQTYEAEATNIRRDNPVFDEYEGKGSRAGEILKTEEEITLLKLGMVALMKNEKLLESGGTIPDFRGAEYYINVMGVWTKSKTEEIGVDIPEGTTLTSDLSDQQRTEIAEQDNTERIAKLSSADSAVEYGAQKDGVLNQAVAMRSKLEIQGVSIADALTQSQAFLAEEDAKLKIIYGVN